MRNFKPCTPVANPFVFNADRRCASAGGAAQVVENARTRLRRPMKRVLQGLRRAPHVLDE